MDVNCPQRQSDKHGVDTCLPVFAYPLSDRMLASMRKLRIRFR